MISILLLTLLASSNNPPSVRRYHPPSTDPAMSVRCISGCSGGGGEGSGEVSVTNWPSSTAVSNFPTTQTVSGTLTCNGPLTNTQLRAEAVPVSGSMSVSNWPATQPVSGSVSVSNFPASQAVTGTFFPATQPVSIASMPSTPVTGPLTDAQLRASAVPVAMGTLGTPWRCSLDALAATLTQCIAAAPAGQRHYVTDIAVQTSTATSGTYSIQTGTGANCGTGTAAMWPALNTTVRFNAPINSQPMFVANFTQPLQPPLASAICVIGIATNTIRIQLQGYTAP